MEHLKISENTVLRSRSFLRNYGTFSVLDLEMGDLGNNIQR
jgi:hypothetical protein